jgi:hypothetical protein
MPSIYAIEHNVAVDAELVEQYFNFRVFRKGLNHVAGIIYSTDGWASRAELCASFSGFNGEAECFSIGKYFGSRIDVIEYVIWCEDYRCIDDVKKIYKTSPLNGGEPFIVRIVVRI